MRGSRAYDGRSVNVNMADMPIPPINPAYRDPCVASQSFWHKLDYRTASFPLAREGSEARQHRGVLSRICGAGRVLDARRGSKLKAILVMARAIGYGGVFHDLGGFAVVPTARMRLKSPASWNYSDPIMHADDMHMHSITQSHPNCPCMY